MHPSLLVAIHTYSMQSIQRRRNNDLRYSYKSDYATPFQNGSDVGSCSSLMMQSVSYLRFYFFSGGYAGYFIAVRNAHGQTGAYHTAADEQAKDDQRPVWSRTIKRRH